MLILFMLMKYFVVTILQFFINNLDGKNDSLFVLEKYLFEIIEKKIIMNVNAIDFFPRDTVLFFIPFQ